MSRGTRRDDRPTYDLDPIAQAVRDDLIDEVARRGHADADADHPRPAAAT